MRAQRLSGIDLDRMEVQYNAILPGLGLSRFLIWFSIFSAFLPFVVVPAASLLEFFVAIAVQAGALSRRLYLTGPAVVLLGEHIASWWDVFAHPVANRGFWLIATANLLAALFANRYAFPFLFVVFWAAVQLLAISMYALLAWQEWPAVARLTTKTQPFFEAPELYRFIVDAWRTIVLLWFATVTVVMIGRTRSLDAQSRNTIADLPAGRIGQRDLTYLFGLPPTLRHAARKWTTAAFWVVGNFTIMFPFIIASSLSIALWVLAVQLEPQLRAGSAPRAANSTAFAEVVLLIMIILALCIVVFRWLLLASRSYLRQSIEALQTKDDRKPVLFLRSFRDDAVTLKRPSLFPSGCIFDIGRAIPNLELIVLQEATPVGPVVALGNPRDKIPPYGIARGYFKNSTWQSGVGQLAVESHTIVISLDQTDGVVYEVKELILPKGLANRTLFLIHPSFRKIPQQAVKLQEMLRMIVAELATGSDVASHDFSRSLPLAIYKDRQTGELQVIYSSTFSWTAYFLTVRRYFRFLGEGRRA